MLWFKILLGVGVSVFIYWWNQPVYINPGTAKLTSVEIKRAMVKMGPHKTYRVLTNGRLQVLVKEKWLFLKY